MVCCNCAYLRKYTSICSSPLLHTIAAEDKSSGAYRSAHTASQLLLLRSGVMLELSAT